MRMNLESDSTPIRFFNATESVSSMRKKQEELLEFPQPCIRRVRMHHLLSMDNLSQISSVTIPNCLSYLETQTYQCLLIHVKWICVPF